MTSSKIADLILQSGLGSLDVAQCQHLFEWDVALLFGKGEPIATRKPESLELTDVEDWQYRDREDLETGKVIDFRNKPDIPAPSISAPSRRRELATPKIDELMPTFPDRNNPLGFAVDSKTPNSLARPNATIFQILQASPGIENPLIDAWAVKSLDTNFYQQETSHLPIAHLEGMQYIFDGLSEALDYQPIRSSLMPALGAVGCAQTVIYSVTSRMPAEQIEHRTTNWLQEYWLPLIEKGRLKLEAIAHECHRWQDKALLPVVSLDETVDELLTAVNMATCVVALQSLTTQKNAIASFLEGGAIAVGATNKVILQQLAKRY